MKSILNNIFFFVLSLIPEHLFAHSSEQPIRGIWLTEAASAALDSNLGVEYAVALCS